MRRLMMLLLALLIGLAPTSAYAELAQEVLLPDGEEVQEADPELRRAVVKSLFMAAAGTDFESEAALIEELKAQEEQSAKLQSSLPPTDTEIEAETEQPLTPREERRAYLAQYRSETLPWLLLAFAPEAKSAENGENAAEDPAENAADTPAGMPEDADQNAESGETEPIWTPEIAHARFSETDTGRNYLAMLKTLGAEEAESCLALTQEICRAWMEEVEHEKLSEINGDYACWLYCADTQIDYPVVHGEDNSYYLKRLFNGAKNSGGTLFVDYRNLPGFEDPNTLIYGHHMRNDSMFGILTEYEKPGFYESHPYVLMLSADEIAVIELFAGYTTSENDHCYDIAISGEEDMAAFVQEAEAKSDFETEVEILTHDRLTTLSTCAYSFRNARYIVIGRLISVWRAEAHE